MCGRTHDVNPERLIYNLLKQRTANTSLTFIFTKIQSFL
jgi:hypothetical protein